MVGVGLATIGAMYPDIYIRQQPDVLPTAAPAYIRDFDMLPIGLFSW
jgi:hypothetical protein